MKNNKQILIQIKHKTEALNEVLEMEFSALKEQDLEIFEKLQLQKASILETLSDDEVFDTLNSLRSDADVRDKLIPEDLILWDQIIARMAENKKLHQRNEILINTKLESIRSALRTLQTPDPLSSVEVYDKLGKIKSRKDQNRVGDA